jgi:hypothetical protein
MAPAPAMLVLARCIGYILACWVIALVARAWRIALHETWHFMLRAPQQHLSSETLGLSLHSTGVTG